MTTKVKVGKETITAIVDSGADINYVNKKWCDRYENSLQDNRLGLGRRLQRQQKKNKNTRSQH